MEYCIYDIRRENDSQSYVGDMKTFKDRETHKNYKKKYNLHSL